jgi:hypothetical protein
MGNPQITQITQMKEKARRERIKNSLGLVLGICEICVICGWF